MKCTNVYDKKTSAYLKMSIKRTTNFKRKSNKDKINTQEIELDENASSGGNEFDSDDPPCCYMKCKNVYD